MSYPVFRSVAIFIVLDARLPAVVNNNNNDNDNANDSHNQNYICETTEGAVDLRLRRPDRHAAE